MFHDSAGMESPKPVAAPCILGVEGGGTKTDWVLLDPAGVLLREGRLPAANLKLSTDAQLAGIFSVLPREATAVGLFLAGCILESDRERLRHLGQSLWPHAALSVGNDCDSGLAAALGDQDGIIVISGTGAVVQGRRGGRVEKAGGWGHILGDRGGGYDLGRFALRQVIRHYDLEGTLSPLATSILAVLGLNDLLQVDDWAIHADKTQIANLAPIVFQAAAQGDAEVRKFLVRRAGDLADCAVAVVRRLGFGREPIPVRLLGGLLMKEPSYAALFREALRERLPAAEVEACPRHGAIGAAYLAAKGELPQVTPAPSALAEAQRTELAVAATEQPHERAADLERLSVRELVELFVEEEDRVRVALAASISTITRAVELVYAVLLESGRLFYVGAGTSGRLGMLDASEMPPTFGTPPELVQGLIAGGAPALLKSAEGAEDSPEGGALALRQRGLRAGDVVCGLTASGRTPFVLGALAEARATGAKTIFLTCNPARHPSADPWDVEIDLPTGAEIVSGSTRLKAGTATKVALNIISTCAMIRLGRVHGGAMIDLRATNAKLRDRAIRIVATALECPPEAARERLRAADWSVRAALENAAP
jgi:N-acetylmuramic acid 6-phosphate etherase